MRRGKVRSALLSISLSAVITFGLGYVSSFSTDQQSLRSSQRCAQDQQSLSMSSLNAIGGPSDELPIERNNRRLTRQVNFVESTSFFYEQRPRRSNVRLEENEGDQKSHKQRSKDYREEWGWSHYYEKPTMKDFPSTMNQVVEEAFSAVAGTIYEAQKMDPNVVNNAMSKTIFTQRPVRKKQDIGRIGIEIDGAELLSLPSQQNDGNSRKKKNNKSMSSAVATRRFALLLAAKLASFESWEPYQETRSNDNDNPKSIAIEDRKIVVCFNTIKQALVATNDLKRLHLEYLKSKSSSSSSAEVNDNNSKNNIINNNDDPKSPFDRIAIQCIHDGVPKELQLDKSKRRKHKGLANGFVNATKGFLLVVQPTDYNAEHEPAGPAIDAVGRFQRLAAQASVEEVPVIAISPRFLSNENPHSTGWDQSGYQQSSTYGGLEPPKGPTPWVMRDFTPPVYCWIGDALRLPRNSSKRTDGDTIVTTSTNTEEEEGGGGGEQCHLARMALTQSVMEEGHSWQVYVAKECTQGNQKLPTEYIFLGSTGSAAGRPTRTVLQQILQDCWTATA